MQTLCCSHAHPYRDRRNVDEAKFVAFLESKEDIPKGHSSQGTGSTRGKYVFIILVEGGTKEGASKRYFGCQDINKSAAQLPTLPPPVPVAAKEPTTVHQPQAPPAPAPVPPYRPRIATAVQVEPMRKPHGQWGSGWSSQRPSSGGPASSDSWERGNTTSTGHSNPRRASNNNGPPSWVSPDVADSKSSWRNPSRRLSAASNDTRTSPISPRSPGGGRGMPNYFGMSRSTSDGRKGGFGGVKSPASVTSHSERETSAWDSASNATDTTWNNRFAMLDGVSTVDDGVSDTSEVMDGERLREMAELVVMQDDEEDFPSLVSESAQISERWQKTGPIRFVEIGDADVKKSGMRRNHHHKMFRCLSHDAAWTLYVYVPLEEEDAV